MNSELNDAFQRARADPTLLNTLDIDKLLSSETEHSPYLANQTLNTIARDVYDAICEIPCIVPSQIQIIVKKLMDYRYVDEVYKLRRGKHLRWVRTQNPDIETSENIKLANGAVVVDVKFNDGVYVVCRAPRTGGFFQLRFDDCIMFQKLSSEEYMVLIANNA